MTWNLRVLLSGSRPLYPYLKLLIPRIQEFRTKINRQMQPDKLKIRITHPIIDSSANGRSSRISLITTISLTRPFPKCKFLINVSPSEPLSEISEISLRSRIATINYNLPLFNFGNQNYIVSWVLSWPSILNMTARILLTPPSLPTNLTLTLASSCSQSNVAGYSNSKPHNCKP